MFRSINHSFFFLFGVILVGGCTFSKDDILSNDMNEMSSSVPVALSSSSHSLNSLSSHAVALNRDTHSSSGGVIEQEKRGNILNHFESNKDTIISWIHYVNNSELPDTVFLHSDMIESANWLVYPYDVRVYSDFLNHTLQNYSPKNVAHIEIPDSLQNAADTLLINYGLEPKIPIQSPKHMKQSGTAYFEQSSINALTYMLTDINANSKGKLIGKILGKFTLLEYPDWAEQSTATTIPGCDSYDPFHESHRKCGDSLTVGYMPLMISESCPQVAYLADHRFTTPAYKLSHTRITVQWNTIDMPTESNWKVERTNAYANKDTVNIIIEHHEPYCDER
ncbi:MAG: hypothetical protein OCD01_05345 [Fibrobacterales bacterium]